MGFHVLWRGCLYKIDRHRLRPINGHFYSSVIFHHGNLCGQSGNARGVVSIQAECRLVSWPVPGAGPEEEEPLCQIDRAPSAFEECRSFLTECRTRRSGFSSTRHRGQPRRRVPFIVTAAQVGLCWFFHLLVVAESMNSPAWKMRYVTLTTKDVRMRGRRLAPLYF